MSEEYRWITGGTEGGGEIPPEAVNAILVVAGSIDEIIAVSNYIKQVGDITIVDGNLQSIQLRRQNDADWLASNPILKPGEMALVMDANPKIVKIGDGVTPFDELPVVFSTSSINIAELLEAVQAAKDAQAAAEAAAATAIAKSDAAVAAATTAGAKAIEAENWAIAEATSSALPSGEKSSKEYARLAGLRAQESRLVKRRGIITAAEVVPSGALYKITQVRAGSPIIVTVPAQIFASADAEEAWAIYRMEQAGGTVQFLPQTGGAGADLQSAFIVAQTRFFRRVASVGSGQAAVTGRITVPAVTSGKLYISAFVNHTGTAALTNSATVVPVSPLTGTYTTTPIKTLSAQPAANVFSSLAWEAPLTAFAGGDLDITISSGPNCQFLGVFVWAVEGPGATATRNNGARADSGASISATLTALDKASLVLVAAIKRGNEADVDFSSFSTTVGLQAEGGTSAWGDANQTDPIKNGVWGVGAGNANVTGDFAVSAAWNISAGPTNIIMLGIPPKTVTGAGNAVCKYKGGVDTLDTLYGKAVLWFDPDGKTVVVDIG